MNFIIIIICLLRIAILILITGFIDCASISCGPEQYTRNLNNTVTCLDCPICSPGEGSVPQCGAFMKEDFHIECKSCEFGKTFSRKNATGSCEPCSVCLQDQLVEKNCTKISNTVCGKCRAGYYTDWLDLCEKCPSSCCKLHSEDTNKECQYQACQDYAAKTCVTLTTVKAMTSIINTKKRNLSTGSSLQPSSNSIHGTLSTLVILCLIITALVVVVVVVCYFTKQYWRPQISRLICRLLQIKQCVFANGDVDNETDDNQLQEHHRPSQEVGSPPTASTSGEETPDKESQPLLQEECSPGAVTSTSSQSDMASSSECECSRFRIGDLKPDTHKNICQLLDKERSIDGDYVSLATRLGYKKSDVDRFELTGNPTKNTLDQWGSEKGHNIVALMATINLMKRHDVWEILRDEIQEIGCSCGKILQYDS